MSNWCAAETDGPAILGLPFNTKLRVLQRHPSVEYTAKELKTHADNHSIRDKPKESIKTTEDLIKQ